MTKPTFTAGLNIAMKIPRQHHEATVAFYRDVLGFEVEEMDVTDAPTVSRTATVRFGPVTWWLDRVGNYSQPDLWLELGTDDLEAATELLATMGIEPVDEVEPLTGSEVTSHWIKNPAGVVHLLAQDGGSQAGSAGDDS